MKSEIDIEILFNRMETFLEQQGNKNQEQAKVFKCALHVLDWVLEHKGASDFSAKSDKIVATFRKRRTKRVVLKRVPVEDHFAI